VFYGEPLYVCAQRETVGSAGELAATTLNACLHLLHNRGWRRWRDIRHNRAALSELSLLHGVEFAVQLG
jgi:hypothetical protein